MPARRRHSPEASFLRAALRGEAPAATDELIHLAEAVEDWPRLCELAVNHRVAPWLLACLADAQLAAMLPADAHAILHDGVMLNAIDALVLEQTLLTLVRELSVRSVPVILLKGATIAHRFYPSPELRPYGDLDVLVPLSEVEPVSALCDELGYEVEEDHGGHTATLPSTCEAPFETLYVHPLTGVKLDVHFDHFQTGLQPRTAVEVWDRSEDWAFQGQTIRVPALNDLFLMLAVHLHRHGFSRLLWFKDLDLIVRRRGEDLDWQWLEVTARREGVLVSLSYTLRLLGLLLETPLPEAAVGLTRHGVPTRILCGLLWPEEDILSLEARSGRWRRAVQYVPWDGLRGALPSLLLMGRRGEKVKSLRQRMLPSLVRKTRT